MAIIKLVVTRKVENANVTFGEGRLKAATVTGEVYDAEGYKVLFVNPETGLPKKADLSMSLLKCTATVSFAGNADLIKEQIAGYFAKCVEDNIFQIKVGIVIDCKSVSKPVEGMHPTLKIPTMTVLLNNAKLIDVEEPELLEMAEDIVESTTVARENTKEKNKVGLAGYLAAKANKAVNSVTESLMSKPTPAAPGPSKR